MSEPEEIATMSGQKLQLKMSVDYISFSAHTDYQQTSEFIRALKPPHVVRSTGTHSSHFSFHSSSTDCSGRAQILVHGEQNEMARLKAALIREYEDNDQVHIEVHNPRNTEAVTLNFRGEKLAKVNNQDFLFRRVVFSGLWKFDDDMWSFSLLFSPDMTIIYQTSVSLLFSGDGLFG